METNKNQDPRKKFQDDLANQMQQGVAPWQISRPAGFEMPLNAANGESFHPYNAIKLLVAAHEKGYSDPRWMTYDDAQRAGYQVLKGESATMIEKYQKTEWVPEFHKSTGEPVLDDQGKQAYIEKQLQSPKLVPGYLFNAAQIEGMPEYERQRRPYSQKRVESLLRESMDKGGVRFEAGAEKSFYSPSDDTIRLRAQESYATRQELHGEGLRGLAHWAANSNRLNLTSNEAVGTVFHARDQIRIEIFSMIAASEYGMPHTPKGALSPNEQLIKALKNNPSDLRNLASDASAILSKVTSFDKEREVVQTRNRRPVEPVRITPRQNLVFQTEQLSPVDELKAFAKDLGVILPAEPVLNGEVQKVLDSAQKIVATYQGRENGPVTVENTVTGKSAEWIAKGYHLSAGQKSDLQNAAAIARSDRAADEDSRYRQAAQKCTEVLKSAQPLSPESAKLPEFLSERNLKAYGLLVSGSDILLPAQDLEGKVWSYQAIDPAGQRSFPPGSKTLGCMAVIGGKTDQLAKESAILIAESYESAAALHDVSKKPVVIAFSADNVQAVAKDVNGHRKAAIAGSAEMTELQHKKRGNRPRVPPSFV